MTHADEIARCLREIEAVESEEHPGNWLYLLGSVDWRIELGYLRGEFTPISERTADPAA